MILNFSFPDGASTVLHHTQPPHFAVSASPNIAGRKVIGKKKSVMAHLRAKCITSVWRIRKASRVTSLTEPLVSGWVMRFGSAWADTRCVGIPGGLNVMALVSGSHYHDRSAAGQSHCIPYVSAILLTMLGN